MSFPFSGNAIIASGNGSSLLATSNVTYSNGTRVVNGNAPVYFGTYLVVNAGANAGNVSSLQAGNALIAANMPVGIGLLGIASVPFIISPGDVIASVGGNLTVGDANQTFFAASAATAVTFKGL